MNLTELGIGVAISFNMFDAIAKDDTKKICALMNFYRKTYKAVGCIVIILGLSLTPFIKIICKSELPGNLNIYVLYLLYLLNTILTYFLYSYRTCLLHAHQQNNISNNISTITYVILSILQMIFLLMGKNYYYYVTLTIFATLINNIIVGIVTSKIYPTYKPERKFSRN